jgi:hypothetical protein
MSSMRPHVAAFVLAAVAACGGTPPQSAASQPPAAAAPAPAHSASASAPAADYLPLPQVPFAPARPMPVVEEVFHFAADHPEVLRHIPCFCGCESRGHKDNDDCFVAARDERGRVTAWEPHGIG